MKEEIINKKNDVKSWIKKNPKLVFGIMIFICIISIIYNVGKFIEAKNNPTTMEKISINRKKIEEKNKIEIEKIMIKRSFIEELDSYREYDSLTKSDSLRIEYLIQKINQNE